MLCLQKSAGAWSQGGKITAPPSWPHTWVSLNLAYQTWSVTEPNKKQRYVFPSGGWNANSTELYFPSFHPSIFSDLALITPLDSGTGPQKGLWSCWVPFPTGAIPSLSVGADHRWMFSRIWFSIFSIKTITPLSTFLPPQCWNAALWFIPGEGHLPTPPGTYAGHRLSGIWDAGSEPRRQTTNTYHMGGKNLWTLWIHLTPPPKAAARELTWKASPRTINI